jgi:anti-sigma factor ChrR (cupin superfamily)
MEPGAALPYHEHVQLEQSFVLAGTLSRKVMIKHPCIFYIQNQ